MSAGAKAALPRGGVSGGKGYAPLGRGLQWQMLPYFGEEPAGAKAALSRGGVDGGKGCTPSGRGPAGAMAVLSRRGASGGKGCTPSGRGPAGAKAAYILRKPNLPVRVMFIISFI